MLSTEIPNSRRRIKRRFLCADDMGELQKASLWKRVSAYLFDLILLVIVALGLATLLSTIFGYDGYVSELTVHYDRYADTYGIDVEISGEEYEKLSQEEKERYAEADAALRKDAEVQYLYGMMFRLSILMITLSILVAYLALEFTVPLLFGNGQTLGKKIFGVAVMRQSAVKISPVILFIRTILGKYTIETMVPVFLFLMIRFGVLGFVGTMVICGILLLNVILVLATSTSSAIHDLLADTVTVDMASQRIFDSEEELIAYKKRIHEEAVQRAEY